MDITKIIAGLENTDPTSAKTLTEFQKAHSNNISRISDLEKNLKQSSEKRDQLKTLIRNATGLEEITEEALTEALNKDGQVDVYKKEIKTLQEKLLDSASVVDKVSSQYERQIFDLQLDRVINMMGVHADVHNQHAYKVIMQELAKNAVFDGKDIVYKNEDGTTIYASGGNPATARSQYEALRSNEDFGYLFKEQFVTGGGKAPKGPTTTSSGDVIRRSKLSDEDKVKYIAKNGMDAYKQLPY